MKPIFTIYLISGFTAIAVFGFSAMDAEGTHELARCIAALTGGGLCPPENDTFSFAAFHLNAFQKFSQFVPAENPAAMHLLFFITLLLAAVYGFYRNPRNTLPFRPFAFTRQQRPLPIPSRLPLTRWLALHENSPSLP